MTNCLGLIGVLLLRLDDGVATVALSVVEEFACCGDDCFACLCPGNLEGTLAGVVTGLVVPGSVGTGRSLLGLGVPSCVGTGRSLLGPGGPGLAWHREVSARARAQELSVLEGGVCSWHRHRDIHPS